MSTPCRRWSEPQRPLRLKLNLRQNDLVHTEAIKSCYMLGLSSQRQWYINDLRVKNRREEFQVCIWVRENELDLIANLEGTSTETKRYGTCNKHHMQIWVPESQLPRTRVELFKTRQERLQSLRKLQQPYVLDLMGLITSLPSILDCNSYITLYFHFKSLINSVVNYKRLAYFASCVRTQAK